jgi:3-hydroxymyristoyl/3-hydroxydecanoyl-(acyl carrier protein) dehydratase
MLSFSFTIPETHPALAGHFPNNPLVPGVVILDRVLQGLKNALENTSLAKPARARLTIQTMKFKAPLRPNELATVLYTLSADTCSFTVSTLRDQQEHLLTEGKLKFEAPGPRL